MSPKKHRHKVSPRKPTNSTDPTDSTDPEEYGDNHLKDKTLVKHFEENIGNKVFILTEAYPFMFIGKIKDVMDDMAVLSVQTTSVPALEDKEWTVHLHSIEIFYIEKKDGPKIPELNDDRKGEIA